MPRYAIKVEYHGAPFAGWQRQKDQPSVQGRIEAALARLEPRDHTIAAAGRTDAGVHATGQVAHCDMEKDWDPFRLSEALNHHLKPEPVAILACARVDDDWHARFSALERRYFFRLLMRRAPATHDAGLVWQVNHELDVTAMQDGANRLLGLHDFTTFRSSICQAASPIKTLDAFDVARIDGASGPEIQFTLRARASCTIRFAALSEHWNASAPEAGRPTMSHALWTPVTARPAGPFARHMAFISQGSGIRRILLPDRQIVLGVGAKEMQAAPKTTGITSCHCS